MTKDELQAAYDECRERLARANYTMEVLRKEIKAIESDRNGWRSCADNSRAEMSELRGRCKAYREMLVKAGLLDSAPDRIDHRQGFDVGEFVSNWRKP